MANKQILNSLIYQVKNETKFSANTALRVGRLFEGVRDYYDNIISSISAGYEDVISVNDPAPTPAKTAKYMFSDSGNVSYATSVLKTAEVGDTLICIYDILTGIYSYEIIETERVVISKILPTAPAPTVPGLYEFSAAGTCTWITAGAVDVNKDDNALIYKNGAEIVREYRPYVKLAQELGNNESVGVSQKVVSEKIHFILSKNYDNIQTKNLKEALFNENLFISDECKYAEVDLEGNIGYLISKNGNVSKPPHSYLYDVNMFTMYGQSLSQGDWETHILSETQKYNSLMFTGGIRTWESRNQSTRYDALVPAVERSFVYNFEVDNLTFNSGASSNGNISITLNGQLVNISVTSSDNTPALVAAKVIAQKSLFTAIGWDIYQEANVIICYYQYSGICSAPIFSAGSTGVSASFERIQEGEVQVGARARGETPATGAANKLIELINDEDGISPTAHQYKMLLNAPGMGGKSIAALSKGSEYYTRFMTDVDVANQINIAQGRTFGVNAVAWLQGEDDLSESYEYYYGMMETLFNDINSDIKSITGQKNDVQFILYQTLAHDFYGGYHYPNVALAQLAISLDKPNIHMASPIYHLPKISDHLHLTAVGSHLIGGYIGIAYKRTVIDGIKFKPIHPISHSVIGNCIYIKFYAPTLPIVIDIENIADQLTKGFQIKNLNDFSQNSFLDIITGVEINKIDTIKITCSSSPVGKKLTYCMNGTGEINGSKGNLRDSSNIKFSFKESLDASTETEHDMYNWCPIFEIKL